MPDVRIASLLPSATEICYALGLGDRVVGVSHECDYPGDARNKPILTSSEFDDALPSSAIDAQVRSRVLEGLSLFAVDEARLIGLKPNVILTQDTCEVCAVPFAQVERATLGSLPKGAEIMSLSPRTFEDVLADMNRVGARAGVVRHAQTVTAGLATRLDKLRAHVRSFRRPRVLFLEWLDPPMVAGHWTPSLLRAAGGDPIDCHDAAPTRATSWEALASADPDVIIIAPCGFTVDKTLAELQNPHPVLAGFRAVAERRAYVADGSALFNRPGPRLVDSAEVAAAALHPRALAGTFAFNAETLTPWTPPGTLS